MKLVAFVVACAQVLLSACQCAATPPNAVAAERERSGSFDAAAPGALPSGWRAQSTGSEAGVASWSVRADQAACSAPNVLALTATNHASESTFNMCWTDTLHFVDAELELGVRADAGAVDQGGGPAWRVLDADNYYVARFNPLESNFRVYIVQDGHRRQLATAAVKIAQGEWHVVRVRHVGKQITCWLDGRELLNAQDITFEAGGVGLWTKADARTSFDDLRVVPAPR